MKNRVSKDVLTQYSDMVQEIKDLESRIRKIQNQIDNLSEVSDTVTGTRKDGTFGTIKITGFPQQQYDKSMAELRKKKISLEEKRDELSDLTSEVENFIDAVEDSHIRRILRFRYLDGMSWNEVAINMGGGNSVEGCRSALIRFLAKSK